MKQVYHLDYLEFFNPGLQFTNHDFLEGSNYSLYLKSPTCQHVTWAIHEQWTCEKYF